MMSYRNCFRCYTLPSRLPRRQLSQYEFDAEPAALNQVTSNRFTHQVSRNWSVKDYPNAINASRRVVPSKHILSLSGHFFNKTLENTEAVIDVEVLSTSKNSSTALVTISQEDKKRSAYLLTFSERKESTFVHIEDSAPQLPPVEECISGSDILRKHMGDSLRLLGRYDFHIARDCDYVSRIMHTYEPQDKASVNCWLRFADRRPMCLSSMAFLNDCLPPPVLAVSRAHWLPTVEYSVQFWGIPTPTQIHNTDHVLLRGQDACEWVRARYHTTRIENGLFSTDSQIWSADGQTLLSNARQLAKIIA